MQNNLEYYKKLPYSFVIQPISDESGSYYYGYVLELSGCQSSGDTFDEAFAGLLEAMDGYIQTKLDHGYNVPLPAMVDDRYSGKFNVRIPKSLHQRLSLEADKEGVSLNQYAIYKLSK